jgi:predicted RNA binding protein YcfA (HicA-like mRNA interferase family)
LGKLPILSGKAVCDILAQHGFARVRQRGSHVIMQKTLGATSITVPVPDHSEIRTGTLLSIIRQSGLTRDAFVP